MKIKPILRYEITNNEGLRNEVKQGEREFYVCYKLAY